MTFKKILRENIVNILLPQFIILISILAAVFMLLGLPDFTETKACLGGLGEPLPRSLAVLVFSSCI